MGIDSTLPAARPPIGPFEKCFYDILNPQGTKKGIGFCPFILSLRPHYNTVMHGSVYFLNGKVLVVRLGKATTAPISSEYLITTLNKTWTPKKYSRTL
ncbi:MAG: hypothetical protein IT292_09610 [Deltaproteobacteria bacterium]|nr:hypothetical protein [Deltaproteobacteria bacterium]